MYHVRMHHAGQSEMTPFTATVIFRLAHFGVLDINLATLDASGNGYMHQIKRELVDTSCLEARLTLLFQSSFTDFEPVLPTCL
jgi:hypothetical protein